MRLWNKGGPVLHLEINVKRRHIYALVLAIALIVTIIPVSSWAAHQFTDVPNSNIFHDDIGWMADNGITLGCNPPDNDEFCPTDNVRRETMAAFMRRLAENQVVDAKTAIDAQNADNADTVDGKDAAELESLAYHVADPSFTSFPASGSADILELDLPAGTYVIVASTTINSNSGSDMPDWSQSECSLVAGTTTQIAENIRLFANGVGDSELLLSSSYSSSSSSSSSSSFLTC